MARTANVFARVEPEVKEQAELYIWHRQEKICGAESCGKVNHRDVQTGDMYILIRILSEDVNMFMHKTL